MKHYAKCAAAFTLCASLILSLAACGKGGTQSQSGADVEQTPAPEYTYKSEYTAIDSSSSAPLLMTDDGFYAVSLEKVGESIPEGAAVEYEGQYDINEARLSFIGYDGSETKLDGYVPLKGDISGEGKRDFSSSSHPEAAALDPDGGLVLLEQVNVSWSEAPESVNAGAPEYFDYAKSQSSFYIRRLNASGAEISGFELKLDNAEYVSSMMIADDGSIVLGLDSRVAVCGPDGESVGYIDANGYIYSMAKLRDGGIGILRLDMSSYETAFCRVDTASLSLDDGEYALPANVYTVISGVGDYDFYYIKGSSLCGCTVPDSASETLLDFIDCDVNGDNLGTVHISEDGSIHAISNEFNYNYTETTTSLVNLTKVPYDAVTQKAHLTLASVAASPNLRKAVIAFNRSSDRYHIDLKDYSESVGDDYEAAQTKLLTEIAAGTLPDLIDISDALPYTQLAAKGILEDIYPYLDSDPELSRDDFFSNVLSAYEVDGRLCAAVPGFAVITVEGASSVVGTEPGWTYDEYYAALSTMPEGCRGFDIGFTNDTMLQVGLSIDLDTYIDWTTGQCRFDGDDFKQLLEFSNTFPSSASLENHEFSVEDGADYLISQGMQMLKMDSVYGFMDYSSGDPFGSETTYIGFPNSSGEAGNIISGMDAVGITSACSDKQAGWEFVRSFLTEEYQKTTSYLPTNRRAFDQLLSDAQKIEYETDANGNILLDENGERMRKVIGSMYDGITYTDIYSGITEERARSIEQLANSATKLYNYDKSILDIVLGEAQAYFSGQKSLDETASLIQSKANIYINEQR